MRVAAIIAAGGTARASAATMPKQFLDLGDGTTMLRAQHRRRCCAARVVDEIVVALPAGSAGRRSPIASRSRHAGVVRRRAARDGRIRWPTRSRASRQRRISIVIHDAARPFVTRRSRSSGPSRRPHAHGAAIAALPVSDTVKQARRRTAGRARRFARRCRARRSSWRRRRRRFAATCWHDAMAAAAGRDVTDEAMLVERAGFPVHLVEGDPANVKVTTPEDLAQARARVLATSATRAPMRIGTGYDLHRLVAGRPLILAGVRIPFDRGLHGHSDADIVCHAVTDAVLGAAALRRHRPAVSRHRRRSGRMPTASSCCEARWTSSAPAGYRVGNVDVTVIAERPKLLPYLDAMRANLAARARRSSRARSASRARPTKALARSAAAKRWRVMRWRCWQDDARTHISSVASVRSEACCL